MSRAIALITIPLLGCLIACGSHHAAAPVVPASSAIKPPTATTGPAAPVTATTPACAGLSICPPAAPDAEGNPPCFYSDGWQSISPGAGIEVWYFHEPQNMSKPDKVTAIVRKKDGTTESQDANIEAGQQVHRFEFATVDQSGVAAVLFDSSSGRCFVAGPGS
jgi:hypothetical protein